MIRISLGFIKKGKGMLLFFPFFIFEIVVLEIFIFVEAQWSH
jgi:hypothetical protein